MIRLLVLERLTVALGEAMVAQKMSTTELGQRVYDALLPEKGLAPRKFYKNSTSAAHSLRRFLKGEIPSPNWYLIHVACDVLGVDPVQAIGHCEYCPMAVGGFTPEQVETMLAGEPHKMFGNKKASLLLLEKLTARGPALYTQPTEEGIPLLCRLVHSNGVYFQVFRPAGKVEVRQSKRVSNG